MLAYSKAHMEQPHIINTCFRGYLQTQTHTPDTYVKTQTFKHTSVATAHTAWQTYKALT